jgi:hypothetical protein
VKIMKNNILKQAALLAAILLFIAASAFRVFAPTLGHVYNIAWQKIAGGGGGSTGGVYAISASIGQPDAGAMTGGRYGLAGGYWAVIATVPTPGAPFLTISRTTTNTAIISWPSPSIGWSLQGNNDLNPANWVASPLPSDNGIIKYIIVNPPGGNRFYRLQH